MSKEKATTSQGIQIRRLILYTLTSFACRKSESVKAMSIPHRILLVDQLKKTGSGKNAILPSAAK